MAIGVKSSSKREGDAAKKVMAVELGKRGAMAKQGEKWGDGKIRKEKGDGRTRNTKIEE